MQRRDFLKAGAAGMALSLAQKPARAQVEPRGDVKGASARDTEADLSVVVIGGDGSVPAKSMVDKYLAAHEHTGTAGAAHLSSAEAAE